MHIIVASKNPVKLEAARNGFAALFPQAALDIHGVSVPSGVSDQPMSDEETLLGAKNRADAAQTHLQHADGYAVGIEGGVCESPIGLSAFAWIVVKRGAQYGYGRTGAFILPDEVAALVRQGLELGDADDRVFNQNNSKQQGGAIGLLSGGTLTRSGFYTQAVILALLPFKNPNLNWTTKTPT